MIDSHAHLDMKEFECDREEVISRALEAGLTGIVNVGFDLSSSRRALELAREHRFVYGAAGVHPHDAKSFDSDTEGEFSKLLDDPRIVAVGEIGIDYYRDLSPREKQQDVFKRLLRLAAEKGKPAIIHCRDAFEDVVRIIEESGVRRGIFHAFSGDVEMARTVLGLGFRLGIGGVITFKNSRLKEVVAELAPESIVLETDCPYLAPVPFRGKRNEPSFLVHIIPAVAQAQNALPEDVARTTDRTFAELMGMDIEDTPAVVYAIRKSLYINMTNRCTNRCLFCAREEKPVVRGHNLRLEREPSPSEIVSAVEEACSGKGYDEIVFCGYGEPTIRLQELIETARVLKAKGRRIRLNTNGLGALFWKRDIVPELRGVVDVISVSLNTADPVQYFEICRPIYGEPSHAAVVDFTRRCVEQGIETVCTAVAYPGVDLDSCEKLARSLGAGFRARKYNVLG